MKHRSRPRVLVYGLLAAAAVVAPFVIYVGGRLEIVKTGYGMDRLEEKIRALEEENRALRLDVARLSDLERIRREATKLGLEPLPLERLVVLMPGDGQRQESRALSVTSDGDLEPQP